MSKYAARTFTAVAGALAMTVAGSAGVASAQSISSVAGLNAGSAVTSTAEYGTVSQYAVSNDGAANLGSLGSLSTLLGSLGNIIPLPGGGGGDDGGISDTVAGSASVTCDGVATVEYDNTASSASARFQTIENTVVLDDRVVDAGKKETIEITDVFAVDVVYVNSKNQPVAVAFATMPDECFDELDNPF